MNATSPRQPPPHAKCFNNCAMLRVHAAAQFFNLSVPGCKWSSDTLPAMRAPAPHRFDPTISRQPCHIDGGKWLHQLLSQTFRSGDAPSLMQYFMPLLIPRNVFRRAHKERPNLPKYAAIRHSRQVNFDDAPFCVQFRIKHLRSPYLRNNGQIVGNLGHPVCSKRSNKPKQPVHKSDMTTGHVKT